MTKKRALVVATQAQRLKARTRLARRAGFEVVACRSYRDARQSLDSRLPDALLTDLRLEEYNGLHLVLMAQAASPHTASFVFSDYDDIGMKPVVECCGARYLLKDDVSEELSRRLEGLTGKDAFSLEHAMMHDKEGELEAIGGADLVENPA